MKYTVVALTGLLAFGSPVYAQFDPAAAAKWASVKIVHYEVVGEIAEKHVQIPPTDADLYADVYDRVTLSFDWDKDKSNFVGVPKFRNDAGKTSHLVGMQAGCPTGSINGPYEHFDIVAVKRDEAGTIELVGKRAHPETSVAESCGAGRKVYKGADEPRTEYLAVPDLGIFALAGMLPADSPMKISADGKSIVLSAKNNRWIWTLTPSVK
jgi:hypothetical protein